MSQQYIGPNTEPVSVGKWFLVWLLSLIPIVGIVMLFVWAFGSSSELSLRNYARFVLILDLIGIVLSIVAMIIIILGGISLGNLLASAYNY